MYLNSVEYKELKSISAYVCNIVEEMAATTQEAFLNKDIKKAAYVKERDKELNNFNIKSDDLCGKIIALYWPRGRDMRYIISSIKNSSDFERIGDHCKKISKQIIKLQNTPLVFENEAVIELLKNVVDIVIKSCYAFYELNKEKAEEVINSDDKIDLLKSKAVKDIIQYMITNSNKNQESNILYFKSGINMVNIARRLERMADHAVNIAQSVYYISEGSNYNKESSNEECISNWRWFRYIRTYII